MNGIEASSFGGGINSRFGSLRCIRLDSSSHNHAVTGGSENGTSYGIIYFSLQYLRISHDDRSDEVGWRSPAEIIK